MLWGLLSGAIFQKSSEASIIASSVRYCCTTVLIRGLANHSPWAKFTLYSVSSPSACFSGLCLTQSVLLALISPECLSLPLAVVRVLRKGVLTHWPLEKQWWLCDSPILHEPVGEGTVTVSLVDMALCV